jgi:hypothetical protein
VAAKTRVLEELVSSGVEFDAVPDLCEMAARRDPRLAELVAKTPLKIAACYPRAVKWLFASAGAKIEGADVEIVNMRTDEPQNVLGRLLQCGANGGNP